MSNKADFYTNKILSNLNGEINYYTGNVLVRGQRVKGRAYSGLNGLSENVKKSLLSQIEKIMKEKEKAYEFIERYKYDKEAFLQEWAKEELAKYEEKVMSKYGDINSLESMDEYLSKNNKQYASTIEGLAAIYGADSEIFLEHKENAINHFKQEIVQTVEAKKEKILDKADKDFNKSASKYLKLDTKREFVLAKLNEKVAQIDEFIKEKEQNAIDELKAKQEEQDLNKKAHDYRVEKLSELGEKAIDGSKKAVEKGKDLAVDAATVTVGAGAYAVEGAVKLVIDAKDVGKEKVNEAKSKFESLKNSALDKTSKGKNKLLGLIEKSKTGVINEFNRYRDKTKDYAKKFGGFFKDAYVGSKTKIGAMANKVKSSVSKERINEIRENSFLSNLNIKERLGNVKNKVTGLGIKGKAFAIDAIDVAKNTDYSKLFKGGIESLEHNGGKLTFNVSPGKFGKLGKITKDREVSIPLVYDEVSETYVLDFDKKNTSVSGGGYNNKTKEKENNYIESIISDKLGKLELEALKDSGQIVEKGDVDANGRKFFRYIDSNSGKLLFLATEYTAIGLDGEEIKKYRCQKTLDDIPELEGLEPKGMLDIGEIDAEEYSKQLEVFEERTKEIEKAKAREKKEKAKEEKAKAKAAKKNKDKEMGDEVDMEQVENENPVYKEVATDASYENEDALEQAERQRILREQIEKEATKNNEEMEMGM